MPFISISAPSIVSGMSGESEKTLRETFEEAQVSSSSFALHPTWSGRQPHLTVSTN